MDFKGKNILITGAASGVGKSIAESFGRLGGSILLVDKNVNDGEKTTKGIVELGGNAEFFYIDLSDIPSIETTVKNIIEKYKKIDVLINNAGICPMQKFYEIELYQWDNVIRINLTSAFFLIKEISKFMMSRKYGKIINISSVSAKMGGVSVPPHYVVSKGGLDSMTRYFAKNLAEFNINVNAISGSTMHTKLNESWQKGIFENIKNITPLNRLCTVSDMANAAIFLASDDSSFITGEIINVNGGLYMD